MHRLKAIWRFKVWVSVSSLALLLAYVSCSSSGTDTPTPLPTTTSEPQPTATLSPTATVPPESLEVLFISGHSERDTSDLTTGEGFGAAKALLERDRFNVTAGTSQDLAMALAAQSPPDAVVLADPRDELGIEDLEVLSAFARQGGGLLITLEPDVVTESLARFLSRYGVRIGEGELVDTASFIPPKNQFLHIKRTNLQFPVHEINEGVDVLYVPGSTYLASTVDLQSLPITSEGEPFIKHETIALTTISSWAETSDEELVEYDLGLEEAGPLPIAISVEAVAEIREWPLPQDGDYVEARMVIVGDTDFASNMVIMSADSGALFTNALKWLARQPIQ